MPSKPLAAISLMPEDCFRSAARPLFQNNLVEAVEWSFDVGWNHPASEWLQNTLSKFESEKRLIGHGVNYSPFSMRSNNEWLERLETEVVTRDYACISEHYGFMRAGSTSQGAPLPVPYAEPFITAGQTSLQAITQIANCPVGLENLAFAFSLDDALAQGAILEATLAPMSGFLHFDVHNLYCQIHNFRLEPQLLLATYQLHRVKSIHISGGSWSQFREEYTRRDTHDGSVPPEVFDLLQVVLQHCPYVEFVILERLGHTLSDEESQRQFRADYLKMREVMSSSAPQRELQFRPNVKTQLFNITATDADYYQLRLLEVLQYSSLPEDVIQSLLDDPRLESLTPYVQSFEPRMVSVAQELVRRWSAFASS
jgi:uncharacterized protein